MARLCEVIWNEEQEQNIFQSQTRNIHMPQTDSPKKNKDAIVRCPTQKRQTSSANILESSLFFGICRRVLYTVYTQTMEEYANEKQHYSKTAMNECTVDEMKLLQVTW